MRLSMFSGMDAAAGADLARQLNATRAYGRRPELDALFAAEPQLATQLDVADSQAICKSSGPVVDAAVAQAAQRRATARLAVVKGLTGFVSRRDRSALADAVDARLQRVAAALRANPRDARAAAAQADAAPRVEVATPAAARLREELFALAREAAEDARVIATHGHHGPVPLTACDGISAFLSTADHLRVRDALRSSRGCGALNGADAARARVLVAAKQSATQLLEAVGRTEPPLPIALPQRATPPRAIDGLHFSDRAVRWFERAVLNAPSRRDGTPI